MAADCNGLSRRLVERSLFLYERLAIEKSAVTRGPRASGDASMNRWRRDVAADDDRLFANRMRFDGLDYERAASLMGTSLPETASLPDWALLLDSVRRRMESKAADEWEDDREGFGFDQLLEPFVECALEELVRRDLPASRLMEDTAVRDLERSLAFRLAQIARDTLMYEFSVWKTVAAPRWRSSPAGNGAYRAFVREHLQDGCAKLFDAYPVLARLLAERTQQWIQFVGLLLDRLYKDRLEIARFLLSSDCLGAIAHLNPKMGGSHRGGQTVVCLQLVSGERFLYKPKPLDADREFANVVSWLNERSSIPLKCIPTLYRPDYGWQQYIEVLPCTGRKAVHEYFHRAGMLLCLMYVFGGSDCHQENMLAHNEHPMMVDLETFLCPEFTDSVNRSAMLPAWETRADGVLSPAPSGFATRDSLAVRRSRTEVADANSDRMRFTSRLQERPAMSAVYCGGEVQSADDFLEDVVRGFSEAYRILAANRPAILHERDVRLRYVYRDTRTYASVLANAVRPPALRTGMDFSIQLDRLARVMLDFENTPPHWQIIRAEHEALSRGDIPVFQYTAARTDLCFESGTSMPEYFRRSSLDVLRQRVERLGQRDFDRQIAYIRNAFQCARPNRGETVEQEPSLPSDAEVSTAKAASPWRHTERKPAIGQSGPRAVLGEILKNDRELLQQAEAIGAGVLASAILRDGTASWSAASLDRNSRNLQRAPLRLRLYDGLAGPALFLAALWSVTGDERFRGTALGGAESIVQGLRQKNRPELNSLGAGLGVGSISYALATLAEHLGEERFSQHALEIGRDINRSVIDADNSLDVLSGSAGYIVAVAALWDRGLKDDRLLQNAVHCGARLLKCRLPGILGHRAWPTLRGELHTGFAHGSAGIAYALARLFSLTADRAYLDAALEACQFADHLSEDSSPKLQMRWCDGAPGIGLGRLGMRAGNASFIQEGMLHALRTTASAPIDDLDHLCCGNFGRVDLLLTAAQNLGEPAWRDRAVELASSVIQRARTSGRYAMGTGPWGYSASFHQGMAGIGYQLLRLARPTQFPSVLLWE
jgi:type 2 lantibiotic biosynthesis protein LanM